MNERLDVNKNRTQITPFALRYIQGEGSVIDTHLHLTDNTLINYAEGMDAFFDSVGEICGRPKGESRGNFSENDFPIKIHLQL